MSERVPTTFEDPRRWARCIDCGYALVGLDQQHNCPECGRWFDLDIRQTWTFKPPFAFWPYWMPGLVSAAAIGLIGLAIGAAGGAWGWSLWIGVPAAAGCVLGYGLRVYRVLQVVGALILAGSLVLGVISMNLGGIFCGIVFGAFVMIPVFFGMALGALVRRNLKRDSAFRMRDYLPIVLMFVGMLGLFAIERATSGPSPVVTIATTRVIAATPEACWTHLLFYEEVEHPPPWILRVGLVRPERTTGSAAQVGDVKVCLYNKGRLVKRVTRAVPGKLLEFDVTEQQIGYERDVLLRSGAFLFERATPDGMATRITLTTTFEAKLGPRWAWAWGERWAVRTLHGHVLEGLARNTERAGVPDDRATRTERTR